MADKEPVAGAPPLNLGAGSYDYEKLYGAADKASKIKDPEERDAAIQQAIDDHDEFGLKDAQQNLTPGYKTVEVENKDLGVTESIMVPSHDPKTVDLEAEAAASPPAAPVPAAPKGE